PVITNGVPPPYDGYLSLRALKDKEPQEKAPRTSVQGGTYAASARLHGVVRTRRFFQSPTLGLCSWHALLARLE
ncbi:MAG: hypothetical protein O6950_12845, partial [Gammaproteobacteria bacterium]|nr:hypothetical protein [Gammaproteobacteria bacterium]